MKTRSILLLLLSAGLITLRAQECGKVVISNASKSSPAFIVSLNGVRLSNDYAQSASFKCLDENQYRLKILQAGASGALSFTISSEVKYLSNYLLAKDNVGNYSLVLQSKSLITEEKELETAVSTPAGAVATPTPVMPARSEAAVAVLYQGPVAMSEEVFKRKLEEVKSKNFDDEKVERMKDAFEHEYFKSSQVISLMKLFTFDDRRLEAAKFAYPKTIDQDEFYKTYDLFSFSSSKDNLKAWISKNKSH
ncbi:MAG TPA: DUF4476 domain-containing protein [Bacteroidia bacterium]|nr:DUF4476 domain-containing protein [Bacteroidia bacterium]